MSKMEHNNVCNILQFVFETAATYSKTGMETLTTLFDRAINDALVVTYTNSTNCTKI